MIFRKIVQSLKQSYTLQRLAWALTTISLCTSLVLIFRTSTQRIAIVNSAEVLNRMRTSSTRPTLLLWTTVFGETVEKQKDLKNLLCFGAPISCEISDDRSVLPQAAALIFHARDVHLRDLPDKKYIGQPWILWNQEAPHNSPSEVYEKTNDLFDLELSYRRTADIVAPYGYIAEHGRDRVIDEDIKDVLVRFYTQVGAVSLVSDCSTESRRERYIEELKQYFPVEIYGDCGNRVCPRSSNDSCMVDFSQKYMFFLAFENSLCPDYVTEKLYRTLQYPIIPVVLSGDRDPSLDSLHAFVDAANLTPAELALKLQAISRNFTAYSEYFVWKTRYSAYSQWHPICHVCERMQRSLTTLSALPSRNETLLERLNYAECKQWNSNLEKFTLVRL